MNFYKTISLVRSAASKIQKNSTKDRRAYGGRQGQRRAKENTQQTCRISLLQLFSNFQHFSFRFVLFNCKFLFLLRFCNCNIFLFFFSRFSVAFLLCASFPCLQRFAVCREFALLQCICHCREPLSYIKKKKKKSLVKKTLQMVLICRKKDGKI